jgi:hypothetical protein
MSRNIFFIIVTFAFLNLGCNEKRKNQITFGNEKRKSQITFERTYGGKLADVGRSVQQTLDGGYIITGWSRSFSAGRDDDVYLIRTNASGDTLWTRTYGGIYNDKGTFIQQTSDSSYVITGLTYSFGAGNSDIYLIMTDASGDTLRTRTYGNKKYNEGTSVQKTTDGGYIIAGTMKHFDLIKIDSGGYFLWTRNYCRGDMWEAATSAQQTSDGGYIMAGGTMNSPRFWSDIKVIKTDSSGNVLWTHLYGGKDPEWGRPTEDYICSIQQTSDGGYIITGLTYSFGVAQSDVYLIKTDTRGDTHGPAHTVVAV